MKALRILLVDDHALLRQAFCAVLAGQEDLEVVGTAGTGAEGLELAEKLHPDLVLVDVMLPDMPGDELTRCLKARHALRVIGLSAHQGNDARARMISSGADELISKSVPPAEIFARIRQVGAQLASS